MNTNMASKYTARGRQWGFTLVELLVAMAIAGALLAGIVQVFIGSKATYRVVEDLSRIQESGRFALDMMAWDVRMAGYKGCYSGVSGNEVKNVLKNADGALYNFGEAIEGFDAVNDDFDDGYLSQTLKDARDTGAGDNELEDFALIDAGSVVHDEPDVIIIRAVFGGSVRVIAQNAQNPGDATLNGELISSSTKANACVVGNKPKDMWSGLCEGDIVMVSDCNKSAIFQISSIGKQNDKINIRHSKGGTVPPGNDEAAWGGNSSEAEKYQSGSEIMKAGTRIYFIANRLGKTGNLEPVPSLFVLSETGVAELLAENVEDMQITYGVDEVNSGKLKQRVSTTGLDASDVEAGVGWNAVVSAEIRLLMRSGNDFLAPAGEPQAYTFAGTPYSDHDDRRIRREFANVVTLRNRALQ